MRIQLLLAIVLVFAIAFASSIRIGVIGGGIGGGAFAYFASKMIPDVEIVVFERNDYLGRIW